MRVKFNENRVPLTPRSDMYKTLNILQVPDFYRFNLLKFFHFILYNKYQVFLDNFVPLLPIHSYDTRNTKINLPSVRTSIERQFTIFQLCTLINKLPEEYFAPLSKHLLKNEFYKKCIDSY